MRNPQDNISLKRIINTPTRKIGKTTIETLEHVADQEEKSLYEIISNIDSPNYQIPTATKTKIKQFATLIQFWSQGLSQLTPSELITKIVNDIQYKEYLIKEEVDIQTAEEKYDNIGQLINMAQKIEEKGPA